MARTAYILTFDRDDLRNYQIIHDKIISLPDIVNWWHYIKSSYILIASTSNASNLQNQIKAVIPNKRFFLVEVDLINSNGWLPPKAWDWIRKHRDNLY